MTMTFASSPLKVVHALAILKAFSNVVLRTFALSCSRLLVVLINLIGRE